MPQQMKQFIQWFNQSSSLPALTRASIAHLYFVCIHPFEDGNGRIARALAEKALSQALGQPTLIALSQTIQGQRRAYYDVLERNNKQLEITDWVAYFADTILQAQRHAQAMVEFLIAKARLYDRIANQLNARQAKVLTRLFDAGVNGFEGGLSAENYISITCTSRATATRDLQALVEMGALKREGELKGTRYALNLD
jgi:Fic family protein